MKKSVLFAIATLLAISAIAAPVTPKEALRVAQNFMSIMAPSVATSKTWHKVQHPANLQHLYLFTCSPNGFVIVSDNDMATPVLAFSAHGTFNNKEIPSHVREWLQDYDNEIRTLESDNSIDYIISQKQEWQRLLRGDDYPQYRDVTVGPLLTTTWNQGSYYNTLCPYDTRNDARSVTGCVATAMAQVMKFWNYPTQGQGSHQYDLDNFGTISADFSNTTYRWDKMPNALTSSSSNDEVTSVATLLFHCGVALEMEYSSVSSNASTYTPYHNYPAINWALTDYFDYSNDLHGEQKSEYTNDQWRQMLRDDIDEGRPVIYSGRDVSSGHAFVCDGYNSSNQFHFNWGWGGAFDGFYAIGALNPSGGGIGSTSTNTFNLENVAIFNIHPNNTLHVSPTALTFTGDEEQSTIHLTSSQSSTQWTAISSDDWINISPSSGQGGGHNATISITAANNNTGSSRTTTITIRQDDMECTVIVTQMPCGSNEMCDLAICMGDARRNGWDGASLDIKGPDGIVYGTYSAVPYRLATYDTLRVCPTDIKLTWNAGTADDDCYFHIYDGDNQLRIYQAGAFNTAITLHDPCANEERIPISATINDATMGYVRGVGNFSNGSIDTIMAVANPGYRFIHWDVDSTNPFVLNVNEPRTFHATFASVGDDTIRYENSNDAHYFGLGDADTLFWAIRFDASDLRNHDRLDALQFPDATQGLYVIRIYQGGTIAPDSLIYSSTITMHGANRWYQYSFPSPLPISNNKPLWIVLGHKGGYPATSSSYAGTIQGSWFQYNNEQWDNLVNYNYYITWMIRALLNNSDTPYCSISELPYTQSFEQSMLCWKKSTSALSSTNAQIYGRCNDTESAHSGSNLFKFFSQHNASDYNQYLTSPLLNLDSAADMTFFYRAPDNSICQESFRVRYSTTDNVSSSFSSHILADITTYNNQWNSCSVTIPADAKYVQINYYSNNKRYLHIDDITLVPHIDTIPDNPPIDTVPDNPTIDTIPDNPTIDTIPDNPTIDTIPDNPTIDTIPDNPTIDTTQHDTIPVINNCHILLPWIETFSDSSTFSCWRTFDIDGDGDTWQLSSSSTLGIDGDGVATSASMSNRGMLYPDNLLRTPAVVIPDTGYYQLTWSASGHGEYYYEHYSIYLSLNDSTYLESDRLYSATIYHTGYDTLYARIEGHAGDTLYFFFRHHDCDGLDRLKIDNIGVIGAPAPPDPCIIELPYTETFSESSTTLGCWKTYDANNDGRDWYSQPTTSGYLESGVMMSNSFVNAYTPITPDNWLISPSIILPDSGSYSLSWAVKALDEEYYNEHYSVYVSQSDTALGTMLHSETLTDNRYHQQSVSLDQFLGQEVYIIFRHHDCSNQYRIALDDVKVKSTSNNADTTHTPGEPDNPEHPVVPDDPDTTHTPENPSIDTTICDTCHILLPWIETFDENSATRACWGLIDRDGDNLRWEINTTQSGYTEPGIATSFSYLEGESPILPDNTLISPSIHIPYNSNYTISWAIKAQNPSYHHEHYSVYVSYSQRSLDSLIFSETLPDATYRVRSASLDAFAGRTIYIVFRHHDCTNQSALLLDNVSVQPSTPNITPNDSCRVHLPWREEFSSSSPTLHCWQSYDLDGDGEMWNLNPNASNGYEDEGHISSLSRKTPNTALTPDNIIFSPAIVIPPSGSYILSWASAGSNANNPYENYSVYISNSLTNLGTMIYSETTQETNYRYHTISLNDYVGQTIYVIFRHHQCTNQSALLIDDVSVEAGSAPSVSDYEYQCTVSLPWIETFQSSSPTRQCWQMYDLDIDGHLWQIETNANNGYRERGVAASYSRLNSSNDALSPNNRMVSPRIVLPSSGDYSLSWAVAASSSSRYSEHYSVFITTSPTRAGNLLFEETLQSNAYVRHTISLSQYVGQTFYIVFQHHGSSGQSVLLIDDVMISDTANQNTNPNNDNTDSTDNEDTPCLITLPWTESFSSHSATRQCWTTRNLDNDSVTWTIDTISYLGYNEIGIALSYSNHDGLSVQPDNLLISPAIPLPNDGTYYLSWAAGSQNSTAFYEHYTIYITTTPENLGDELYSETLDSRQYRWHYISLDRYLGDTVYIVFRHHDCTNQSALLIDDVTISTDTNALDIHHTDAIEAIIYPNPTHDIITIKAEQMQRVELYDNKGRLLMTTTSPTLSLKNLTSGTYTTRIITQNGIAVRRIVRIKQ